MLPIDQSMANSDENRFQDEELVILGEGYG